MPSAHCGALVEAMPGAEARSEEPMPQRGAEAGRSEAAVAAATRSRGRDLRLYVRVHDDCIDGGVRRVFMMLTDGPSDESTIG